MSSRSAQWRTGQHDSWKRATIFSTQGIEIDITPPTVGNGTISFSNIFATNICIPIVYDNDKCIDINIAVKGED